MSNLVMWNLIVGFLMPTVVAVVQQPKWSEPVRAGLTAVLSVVAGFVTAFLNESFTKGDIVGSVLITGVAAITFYKGFWKPTGVAPAIESATSSTSGLRRNDAGRIEPVTALVIVFLILAILFLLFQFFDLNVRDNNALAQIISFSLLR